jgi:hypothetical protein
MFTRDQFAQEGDDAGVFMDGLGNALLTFCAMQDHTVTVAEAATAGDGDGYGFVLISHRPSARS